MACVGDYVYVSSEAKLIIFRLSDMHAANNGEQVTCIGTFPVDTEASFCYTDGQFLYVGEFYRPVDYPIDDSHRFVTPAGDEHQALVSVYPLTPTGEIADTYPLYSISIPAQVQGFADQAVSYPIPTFDEQKSGVKGTFDRERDFNVRPFLTLSTQQTLYVSS